jgi:CRISPR-associated protein Cmr3
MHKQQKLSFKFSQFDSWFFRESRPMESVGGSELRTVFPPPVSTLSGAIRTLLGDLIGIDWQAYNQNKAQDLAFDVDPEKLIGHGEACADLGFSYPVIEICENGKWLTLTPAPFDLLELKEDKSLIKLSIGKKPVQCDLGKVRLPALENGVLGAKPLEQVWLKPDGWAAYLAGKLPQIDQLVRLDDLIQKESRLGIARDNNKGTVESGMLYQTEHLRFNKSKFEDIRIRCDVSGIPECLHAALTQELQAVRFGGEGRLAFVEVAGVQKSIDKTRLTGNKAKLVFTAPCYFGADNAAGYLPHSFVLDKGVECDVYSGNIGEVAVKIISQVTGKSQKIGGWDHAKNTPKPLRSFMPVGSCWYIECDQPSDLSDLQFGELTPFGYGAFTLLPWND